MAPLDRNVALKILLKHKNELYSLTPRKIAKITKTPASTVYEKDRK